MKVKQRRASPAIPGHLAIFRFLIVDNLRDSTIMVSCQSTD